VARRAGVVRLTSAGHTFSHVEFNAGRDMYVCTYSALNVPPVTAVFRVDFDAHHHTNVCAVHHCDLAVGPAPRSTLPAPELFSFSARDGETLYGMLIRPAGYDPARRYPTLCYVYGGPCVQLVANEYAGLRHMRLQVAASLGLAVVMVDGRGSTRRGVRFEARAKHSFGAHEISDQVEALEHIMQRHGIIDPARIAIQGWSYGGYVALCGIWQRPDVFRVCIAGAPVTEWEHYDTAYTERYMGLPAENPALYNNANVVRHAHMFPAQYAVLSAMLEPRLTTPQ
jgi:dipeptidyl aminopeptidase/acylaminoacyl peptidase